MFKSIDMISEHYMKRQINSLLQMVYVVKETRKDVLVISDDTDGFLLLLCHFAEQALREQIIMESLVQERVVNDDNGTDKTNEYILSDILSKRMKCQVLHNIRDFKNR
jgi:hypothetical protein